MTRYAIIGDGGAGITAAHYLRTIDKDGEIVVYSNDPVPAYYRAALTNYLMGEVTTAQLFSVPPEFFETLRIVRRTAHIVRVDPGGGFMETGEGVQFPFDRLLVATGGHARKLDVPGATLAGIVTLHHFHDAHGIARAFTGGDQKRVVICGGGILGLELASALRRRGAVVTWLIRGKHVLDRKVDEHTSRFIVQRCRDQGIEVRTEDEAVGFEGTSSVRAAYLASNEVIEDVTACALAIGIAPNLDLLDGSGIQRREGIVVSDRMVTSESGIFAAGDVAELTLPSGEHRMTELWANARTQGRVAAMNMAGGDAEWSNPVPYHATRAVDLDLALAGDPLLSLDVDETGDGSTCLQRLTFSGSNLVGACLIGERRLGVRKRARLLARIIARELDISTVRTRLLDPRFDLDEWLASTISQGERTRSFASKQSPAYSTFLTPTRRWSLPASLVTGSTRGWLRANGQDVKAIDSGVFLMDTGIWQPQEMSSPDPLASIGPSNPGHLLRIRAGASARVNGVVVAEAQLRDGDTISIGEFQFEYLVRLTRPPSRVGPVGLLRQLRRTPPANLYELVIEERRIPVESRFYVVGSHEDLADMTLEADAVEPMHCALLFRNGLLYAWNLAESDMTSVNDRAIHCPTRLDHGDLLTLGGTQISIQLPSLFDQVDQHA